MFGLGLIKGVLQWLFGAITGTIDQKAQTDRARISAQASVATEMARASGVEAQERTKLQTEYVRGGWWWATLMATLPAFIIGMSIAGWFAAVMIDTACTACDWGIPYPPDEIKVAVLEIIKIMMGGGAAVGLGAVIGGIIRSR